MPDVVDLFSGCGGLALGFQKAGFNIAEGVEISPEAVETASYNLHWRFGEESDITCSDITKMDINDINGKIHKNGYIVIGGPPCQAYSLVGRAKLRSLGENRINTKDKRGYLYQDFLRFAIGLDARAVVMENVPESIDYGGKNIPVIVCKELEKNGYNAFWTILNAADFGVPQIRERVFVIAIKKSEMREIQLPQPTNAGLDNKKTPYEQRFESFNKMQYFFRPISADKSLEPWVTVGDAFSDLPELFPTAQSKYILNKINMPLRYCSDAKCKYQKKMREWYGQDPGMVSGNCYRKTTRDFPIFAEMKPGDGYVKASEIADRLFDQACKSQGISIFSNKEQYEKLRKAIVPPYDRNNFKSKWQKLSEDIPSHTLVAHLSVDTYSHIHPVEPRGISVREAARLQSFPDEFLFQCSMGDAFKQIGNAVPPLLGYSIALKVRDAFM